MSDTMLVIDDEAFLAKLAEPPREKNVYPPILTNFKNSGNVAIDLTSRFEGKDLKTVAVGMKAAAKRDASLAGIEVRHVEIDKVEYLALFNRVRAQATKLVNNDEATS
jgi:hypothetical protein